MGDVKLYLFGPPRLEQNGEPLDIPRRKADALLAYLAVTRQPHSRETLAALLWPEYDSSQGRADLSRMLSVLNKALGPEWVEADRETISLNPQFDLWVDVTYFQEILASCESHGHLATEVCPNCLSPLTEAVELYQADFMAGFTLPDAPKFDEWQFFQTESLRQQFASALERLVRQYSNRQEYELAISYARRWLALDPVQEAAHRQLMELYAQSGQQAAAVRQYQECLRMLGEELGVEPQPETRVLYERIRRGPAAQAANSGQTSQYRSAAHDLPRFLTQKSPLLETKKTEFVARERELAQLDEHLAAALSGQGRIVFINGEAGRGKTSLLREFARRAQAIHQTLMVASGNCNAFTGAGDPYLPFRDVMGMFRGDVETRWAAGAITREHARRLWELAPLAAQALVEDGPDLVDVFVSAASLVKRLETLSANQTDELHKLKQISQRGRVGAAPGEQHQLFEQYTQVLHKLAAHHPLLLLLDDLQWADNASINLLFHLGRRLQGAQILIVGAYRLSEVALGRPFAGAEQAEQHPLDVVITELKRQFGDVQLDLGRLTATEGQTFVDALLDTEPNRLGENFRQALFERTKGHPLFTIELLRDMQEQGALVQDEQGFWIEGQEINWPELPARAEAVIEGRIGRLDDELRDILTMASVEGEEFTVQVIARVQNMEEWPLLRQLSRGLEKRHRLVREHEEFEVGNQRLTRYHFSHVLFQQYLYNHLSLAERRMLHGQIARTLEEIYTGHTEAITPQLAHHYFQAGERAKAITYARQAAQRAEAMYAYNEAAQHLHTALALIEPGQQIETRMVMLEQLADVYALLGERPRAIQLYQNALDLWHGLGKANKMIAVRLHRKIGEMVVFMTWFADRQRFEATAQASFEAGLKLTQGESPHPEMVRLLTILSCDAWLTRIAADWNTAEQYAKEAVAMAEQLDTPVELSGALDALATVYGARGLLRERVQVSLRRLELSHDPRFSNAREHAKILQQTGFALTQVGEYTEAMPYLLEAETVSREVQALDQQFRALRWQAYCWFRLDRWNKVLKIDEKWRALEQRYPNFAERVGPTCFLISLSASVHALRGDFGQAEALRNEAVATMVANDGPSEGWERDNRY